ncbi:class I lanthipeptide [Myxococcus qinghaiensis]|uniref:class I lanthipeptide n=1 Tax=Myxococcus qinghaiensis TaxID=2906758 RepID=UPI0020A79461|nr:class I lanthipeptide [Myxococcus qinghaiensis]MCP3163029.1 class I lanthipeptide [Myxococcus qinghaiensis]
MTAQSTKKLSLKKETLRTLDTHQLGQLEGAVGGITPTIPIATIIVITIINETTD